MGQRSMELPVDIDKGADAKTAVITIKIICDATIKADWLWHNNDKRE